MDKPDHVLIVDEDRGAREFVAAYLQKNGMRVTPASSGRDLQAVLERDTPDLVLLDPVLPGEDGLALCRSLRSGRHRALPLLMLAKQCDETDRIIGLEMGADDFLAKPIALRELLARIRAVLRRTRMLPPGMLLAESCEVLSFGDWRLDTTARHLLDNDDAVVALSGAEYRLLRVFLDYPQRVLTRDQLLNLTQRRNAEPFDRSIDLLVSRLRQRLRDVARVPRYIKTLRNEGYVFSSAVKAVEEVQQRQHA
jgi:two-component system OmpR family response regulator